ncbi:hypothetical protein K2173_006914 [Erythroxylum novogranatense]|uniref:Uncharacterized protein n=1 Tax=Erythroxylum novogranatense TaxID=1862640 RepID=A0AAV8SZ37_9ROSI|nr:hypothetical protein K2173_006914 [Erythroxylum novogranatense]
MTMVPAQTLSKQQQKQRRRVFCGGYGSYAVEESRFGLMNRVEGGYDYCNNSEASLGSDPLANPMAEDESRTNSLNEAGSSSKDVVAVQEEEKDEGWLRLSIGGHSTTSHEDSKHHHHRYRHLQVMDHQTPKGEGGLIELDLLPGCNSLSSSSNQPRTLMSSSIFHVPEFRAPPSRPVMNMPTGGATSFSTSLFFQHQQQHHGSSSTNTYNPHHQELNWAFRPIPYNVLATASSSSSSSSSATTSSSSLMPLGSYFSHPLHQVHSGIDVAGPSSEFRVIDPPRRLHSGIWFMLQASQNQAKEPFLPQISKSYLRIKDGRMTVRLLTKYLVNKLRLDSESEVEITCRGQQLLPFLTLQHVRDNIWSPRDSVTLLPHSATTDHVMVLHYGRSA